MTSDIHPTFPLRTHPHLYEINTWAWLEQLSVGAGRQVTLADVPDREWDALAQLGFDIVWLMGVWRRSPESRRVALADPANRSFYDRALPGWKPSDVVGSPYAVVQYLPDPQIGTWQALDRTREKLHARGMSLFLDFVGNHTAFDHPWTREHPEFYVQGTPEDFDRDPSAFYRIETSGGARQLALAKDPYFPPWKDVAQLNHFQPQMRAAHLAELRSIAEHCDGVRCDMAMLQLNDVFARGWSRFLENATPPDKEFWTEARAAVPGLILFAEVYWGMESRLLDLGFSFAYDKGLYDAVRDANIAEVRSRLAGDFRFQSHLARFLENHDEARCAAVFGNERLHSVATLMGTLPGMRFHHQGEREGRQAHLPITLRIAAEEPADPVRTAFFDEILRLSNEEVFHAGEWKFLEILPEDDDTSANLIVYEWRSKNDWRVIVINLASRASQGRVRLQDSVSAGRQYVFCDELDGVRYPRSGEELQKLGLFVRREGFQAHLFRVTSV